MQMNSIGNTYIICQIKFIRKLYMLKFLEYRNILFQMRIKFLDSYKIKCIFMYSYVQSIAVFTSFCAWTFIFLPHSSLSIHSMFLIPFSLIPVVTSDIHEFRNLLFLLLPSGHHSQIFRGSLRSSILYTWPYQFNCFIICDLNFFSIITLFLFFLILNISPISSKSPFPST